MAAVNSEEEGERRQKQKGGKDRGWTGGDTREEKIRGQEKRAEGAKIRRESTEEERKGKKEESKAGQEVGEKVNRREEKVCEGDGKGEEEKRRD